MKRVVIVHLWEGYPESCWYPQTKGELEAAGFRVEVPAMPDIANPKLSLWLPKLQEVVGSPDEDLCLVGHSVCCITIMRYLESLKDNKRVGTVILVAGFTDNLGYSELSNFFETPIDFEKIKSKANRFIVINSDDDPDVPLRYGDILKNKLDAKLIIKHAMGHFDNDANCTSLPDVAQEIISDLDN